MLPVKTILLETAHDVFKKTFHLTAHTIIDIDAPPPSNNTKKNSEEKLVVKKTNKEAIKKSLENAEITHCKTVSFSFGQKQGTILLAMSDVFLDVLEQHTESYLKNYFSLMNKESLIANIFGIILYATHRKIITEYDTIDFGIPLIVKPQTIHNYATLISYGANKKQPIVLLGITI